MQRQNFLHHQKWAYSIPIADTQLMYQRNIKIIFDDDIEISKIEHWTSMGIHKITLSTYFYY